MSGKGSNAQSTAGATTMTAGAAVTATGGGAPVGIPLMAVGAGLSVWGAIKSAQDEADIQREKAALANFQANEIMARQKLNDASMQETAMRSKYDFGSAYAASGHQGIGIGSQLEIQRRTDIQAALNDREAQFQADMIRAGANMDNKLAGNIETSGYINAASAVLGAASKAAPYMTKSSSAESLPSMSGGH